MASTSPDARLARLLAEDQTLAADLLRWAERSRAVGRDGVFAAYRQPPLSTPEAAPLSLRRRRGVPGNRLYHADNLAVLRDLVAQGVRARCVYIDPPYGTRQRFARK